VELTLPEWSMFGLADDMRPAMRASIERGEAAALATLHTIDGRGPRPPGAQMWLSPNAVSGYLSGGCIEGDVALHAAQTLDDGVPRHLIYGEGSPWADIQLPCGARIDILVERVAPDDAALAALLEAADARRPVVLVTDGRDRRIEPAPEGAADCQVADAPFELRRRYDPVPRLAVVGADPVALALASLGSQSGFETILVRPSGPTAPPPVTDVAYTRDDPVVALSALSPDRWTAIAIVSHDWETDERALRFALPSNAGYVGLLGSVSRLPERLERLSAAGVGSEALARLHAPIGLDIGGKAPWEIAVSVIAEIISDRGADRPKEALRHRQRNLAAG
jgi:xanthine dehydrogenase accessory factor